MLAVAGGISPLAFAIIGAARIAIAFVVCHLIGRAYREQALTWFTRYLGFTDEALETYNRGFSAAEIGLIPFFAGSNIVAVLTGIHRTPPVRLAVLLAVGIAGRLVLMWYLAKTFEDQLLDVARVHRALSVVGAGPLARDRAGGELPQLPPGVAVLTNSRPWQRSRSAAIPSTPSVTSPRSARRPRRSP